MKNFILVSTLFVSINLFAQSTTVVDMKITNTKGANGTMKIYVSEFGARTKMKMNMPAGTPGPAGGINIDALNKVSEPSKSYMINESSKTYSVVDGSKQNNQKNSATITVQKIGNETVNGFNCVHAKIFTNGKPTSETWTSKDLFADFEKYSSVFKSANRRGSSNYDAQQQAMKDAGCDGFPVKTITEESEEGTTTMEVLKTEKVALDKSMFEIPTDYKEGNMMKTMTGVDMDMDKIMKMTPAEREAWQKEMMQKMGGQQH